MFIHSICVYGTQNGDDAYIEIFFFFLFLFFLFFFFLLLFFFFFFYYFFFFYFFFFFSFSFSSFFFFFFFFTARVLSLLQLPLLLSNAFMFNNFSFSLLSSCVLSSFLPHNLTANLVVSLIILYFSPHNDDLPINRWPSLHSITYFSYICCFVSPYFYYPHHFLPFFNF